MYYSFDTYKKVKDFLKNNPSAKITSWSYSCNEPVRFGVFVPEVFI